jgi:hypothetical protein
MTTVFVVGATCTHHASGALPPGACPLPTLP